METFGRGIIGVNHTALQHGAQARDWCENLTRGDDVVIIVTASERVNLREDRDHRSRD
jgi:hypothetical protein